METDFSNIYRLTLLIVATGNLVMATTLWLMSPGRKSEKKQYRQSIAFLSVAMLLIAVINYAEWFMPIAKDSLSRSVAIVVFAASLELFLMYFAFTVLLDKTFVTRRKIFTELFLILIFAVPPLFFIPDGHVFLVLFAISILFYLSKFIYNFCMYKRCFHKAQQELQGYYSDDKQKVLYWVNNVFYMILIVGAVSVIVPLTDYRVLSIYNTFLLFAYFYIYIEVLYQKSVFKETVHLLEKPTDKIGASLSEQADVQPKGQEMVRTSVAFMTGREKLFEHWVATRSYTHSGLTIEDVAQELNTNRTTLSIYINSELHLNFYDWISQLRIEDAKKELIDCPTKSIADIAIQVGIEDRSNFDKTFKRLVGISPAMYRRQNMNQPLLQK